ncbi:MAG: Gfo/Idh/MocA family oxidoreductase [Planctomycetes bacterium]|nr:Gfo/Idh/MocA family oxidoreductase [Planctomycetota bacterium]
MREGRRPRREFLRLAAGAAASLPLIGIRRADASAAEKEIRLGVIGTGGRGRYLSGLMLSHAGTRIPAVCDIDPEAARSAVAIVEKGRGERPETYTRGPEDYLRMLEREDLDAVLVTTPQPLHARMSIAALRAGKHVYSEVAAATTLDECWGLVRAVEETGKTYMLGENVCYYRECSALEEMVRRGVFGELTYAECGYIHDCRSLWFRADGSLTWRGEGHRDGVGNLYPTHAIGPVARWLGIERGDRFISLTASSSRAAASRDYTVRRFGEDHPAARIEWKCGDMTSALIRTAKGALIEILYDTASTRPHPSTTHFLLQGTEAAYLFDGNRIYVRGRTKSYAWEPADACIAEFEPPFWKEHGEKARGTGHGGADYFTTLAFLETLRSGAKPPIDVYDAAAWSSIIPLSGASVLAGGAVEEFPDFRRGGSAGAPPAPGSSR